MPASSRLVIAVAVSMLAVAPAAADAQQLAGSFNQLLVLVKPGDTIRVTGVDGQEVEARIGQLSSSSLAVMLDGQTIEFREDQVETILQRRPDSLKEGALWGFGIGAGLATIAVLASDGWERGDAGWLSLAVAFYGGVGAGIGVVVDAMMDSWQVVYARTAASPAALTFSPILAPGGAGVRVSWRF